MLDGTAIRRVTAALPTCPNAPLLPEHARRQHALTARVAQFEPAIADRPRRRHAQRVEEGALLLHQVVAGAGLARHRRRGYADALALDLHARGKVVAARAAL